MRNIVAGVVGVALIGAFLLFYAIRLNSVALWIFIVGAIVLVAADLAQTVRANNRNE